MIYLIDFENVGCNGFNGIEKVTKEDKIFLFYSKAANKISIDILETIKENGAEIEYISAENGSKNSLDFQLCTILGNIINCSEKYIIISQDSGYDTTIRFWNKRGYKVSRQVSFKNHNLVTVKSKNKLPADLKKGNVSKSIIISRYPCDKKRAGKLADILNKSHCIASVKNRLIQMYGKNEATVVFNSLSDIIQKIYN